MKSYWKLLAIASLTVAMCSGADARPKHKHHRHHHHRVTTVAHPDCNIVFPCEGVAKSPRGNVIADAVGFGVAQNVYSRDTRVPKWAQNHTARPRAWCGWWMRMKKGIRDARLNLARNWATLYGRPTHPHPGAVVVWRHHVGELISHVKGDIWVVRSGNDGNAVRTRARSVAAAIAFRS